MRVDRASGRSTVLFIVALVAVLAVVVSGATFASSASAGSRASSRRRPSMGQLRGKLARPKGPGFVSLRATMTDIDGNTSDLHVVHAYRIG